jgi:hypothetical protein
VGQFEPMEAHGDLLTYVRRDRESAFLIALNLGPQPQVVNFSNKASEGRIALSTHLDRSGDRVRGELELRAEEGLLVRLTTESSAYPRAFPVGENTNRTHRCHGEESLKVTTIE